MDDRKYAAAMKTTVDTRRIDFYLAGVALALVMTFLLSACTPANNAGDPGSGAGQDGGTLAGTSWTLTELAGESALAGSTITAEFEQAQVAGNSGCNSYSGAYQSAGGSLAVGEVVMTEMACMEPAGVMEQEQAYLQLLGQAQSYQVSGDELVITTAGGETLRFAR